MNTNNNRNTNPFILSKNGKIFLVFFATMAVFIFIISGLFHIIFAIFAIIAISFSIGLFIKNKGLLTYSLLFLIIGLLFVSGSATMMNSSRQLDITLRNFYLELGMGVLFEGLGLFFITASMGISQINKSGYLKNSEFKYPRYLIVIFLISGIVQIAGGTFIFISGLQRL